MHTHTLMQMREGGRIANSITHHVKADSYRRAN